MAKIDELTVEVAAKLTVSDETAKRCMALLEMCIVPAEGGTDDVQCL